MENKKFGAAEEEQHLRVPDEDDNDDILISIDTDKKIYERKASESRYSEELEFHQHLRKIYLIFLLKTYGVLIHLDS